MKKDVDLGVDVCERLEVAIAGVRNADVDNVPGEDEKHHRRDEAENGVVKIDRAQFASVDAALQNPADRRLTGGGVV